MVPFLKVLKTKQSKLDKSGIVFFLPKLDIYKLIISFDLIILRLNDLINFKNKGLFDAY